MPVRPRWRDHPQHKLLTERLDSPHRAAKKRG
nr:MAG TPA: hypothetical protein [Caudoviricetes sp.]DAS67612.1 MAG TPA: hypothetical protein [Caudoviricetes sp.]